MAKKLYRSATNRMIWGVCGGLGQYFDINPMLVRIVFVILAFASGAGVLLYILLAILLPPGDVPVPVSPEGIPPGELDRASGELTRGAMAAGIILVAIGVVFLLSNLGLFWWFRWGSLWPVILIAIGVAILMGRWRK
ncbi:MAG: PspC domain-containing protein [Chloroflexota bacterium]